jgi:inorganic pyrophosphatase
MTITISAGADMAADFNAIIEIPAEGGQIKYEFNKETGMIAVDRFMATSMRYPCNYGFVPSTLAQDGDPADVLVITPYPVVPGCLMRVRPVAVLNMADEAGEDSKILAVPLVKACPQLAGIQSLADVPSLLLKSIVHFFEHYKDLESGKWVKVSGWEDKAAAVKELLASVKRYQDQTRAA